MRPRSRQFVALSLATISLGLVSLVAMTLAAHAAPQSSSERTFDAISIHPGATKSDGSFSMGMPRSEQDPETMTIHNGTLVSLVCFAFVEDQGTCGYKLVVNGPAWASSDHFDIVARTDAPATLKEKRQMMQAALLDRFHLVLRRETRPTTGYWLELSGRGPKLKPAEETEKCGQEFAQYGSHVTSVRNGKITADCVSVDEIADEIQNTVIKDRPVFDRTGLPKTRLYQLDLEVAFPLNDPNALGPSVFSALPDQLGLQLKADKVPVDVLVIQGAQRPQPN